MPNDASKSTTATRRAMSLLHVIPIIALAGLGTVGGYAYWMRAEKKDSVDLFKVSRRDFKVILKEKGELKAAKSTDIKCEVAGRSTIVFLIAEGTEVKEGDLLVEVASDQAEEQVREQSIRKNNADAALASAKTEYEILVDKNKSEVRKAELALDIARLEHRKYTEGDWPQQLADAGQELTRSKNIMERRDQELKSARDLKTKNYISGSELLDAEQAYRDAEAALQKAERGLNILKEYTYPKDIAQKESDVSEAEKELARVKKSAEAGEAKALTELKAKQDELDLIAERLQKSKDQLAKTKMYAPGPGLVVYETGESRWERRQIAEGAEVFERQTIISLPDTSQMKVVVRIHEAKTDRIRIGQRALVEVEGYPNRVFQGEIKKIAPLADSQDRWLNPDLKEYETEIVLEPTAEPLKPGATARADIIVDDLRGVLAVPIQSVFSRGGKQYVFTEGTLTPREVQIGLASAEYVEIVSGLEVNEQVCLAVSDSIKHALADMAGGKTLERPAETEQEATAERQPNLRQERAAQPEAPATDQPAQPGAPAAERPGRQERPASGRQPRPGGGRPPRKGTGA